VSASLSRGSRHWLWLLLALALVRGLIYATVTPPWQAPDETGHFEYAWLIAHEGRLPSQDHLSPAFEGELLSSLYEWRYGEYVGRPLPAVMPTQLADLPGNVFARNSRTVLSGRFSLAYLWQALFLRPVGGQDLTLQLFMARLSSVLLSLGIIWLAFRTFSELVPSRPKTVLAMTLVVVLIPQHTFINSTVGDGTLAELMACIVLYCWVLLFARGARLLPVLAIVLGTLLAVLSKTTAVFLIPLDLGLALWWSLRQDRQLWRPRHFVYLGIGVVAVGIGAWLASHSPLGANTLKTIQALLTSRGLSLVDAGGMTLDQALLASYDSFWANFGWMAVQTSPRWYGAILLATAIAALGWLKGKKEEQVASSWAAILMGVALLSAFGVFVWAALLSPGGQYYQFQGRYLFPAVIPLAFLLVGGWMKLMPRRQDVLLAGVLFLAVFDAWCMMGYIIPYFYYR
jgi:hypothetical protein